jgi:hypothetical protein
MRRAITGHVVPGTALSELSNGTIAIGLLASTSAFAVVATAFYHWSIRRAWRLGKIEETTGL